MSRVLFTAAFAASFAVGAFSAAAHPGPAIMIAGGAEDRTAMTDGVTYEDANGVHVFRGRTALLGAETAPTPKGERRHIEIDVVIRPYAFRSLRRLRTQGFYSGIPYPSRRYTQGFYSGRR